MSLRPGYELHHRAPSVEEYLDLRRRTGLHAKSPAQAEQALRGSWATCHVTGPSGGAVAMGRVVGDGGWYFVVADMATLPEHQRRGIGRAVLEHLLTEIRTRAPGEAYVALTAGDAGRRLYEHAGFRALGGDQTGMQLVLPG